MKKLINICAIAFAFTAYCVGLFMISYKISYKIASRLYKIRL